MKHGPDEFPINEELTKRKKTELSTITKSMDELLKELNVGNYTDFRQYLIRESRVSLNLDGMFRFKELIHLGNALQGTQIKVLILNANYITASNAEKLSKALKNTQVITLSLMSNNIGDYEYATGFIRSLQGTKISSLCLSSNKIGARDAATMGGAFKGTQVKDLDLQWNIIGDDGAENLVRGLSGTLINRLDLRFNNISEKGAKALAALIPNTVLLDVKLNVKCTILKEALEKNRQKLIMTPLYLEELMENVEKNEKDVLYSEVSPIKELGIFLKAKGDIQNKILDFLPYMSIPNRFINKYENKCNKRANNSTQAENENMSIENNNTNTNHKQMDI